MKQVLNQSNGRANPKYSINQPGTLKYGLCSIPLGSPTVSQKRSFVHVPVVPYTVSGTPSTACTPSHDLSLWLG